MYVRTELKPSKLAFRKLHLEGSRQQGNRYGRLSCGIQEEGNEHKTRCLLEHLEKTHRQVIFGKLKSNRCVHRGTQEKKRMEGVTGERYHYFEYFGP